MTPLRFERVGLRRGPWLPAALAAAVILFAAGPHLAELLRGLPLPGCLFREITGFPCAACGTTRAFLSLAGGSFAGAFSVQPFATAAFFFTAAAIVLPVKLSADGRTAARFLAFYLLLVNWLYLVERGI